MMKKAGLIIVIISLFCIRVFGSTIPFDRIPNTNEYIFAGGDLTLNGGDHKISLNSYTNNSGVIIIIDGDLIIKGDVRLSLIDDYVSSKRNTDPSYVEPRIQSLTLIIKGNLIKDSTDPVNLIIERKNKNGNLSPYIDDGWRGLVHDPYKDGSWIGKWGTAPGCRMRRAAVVPNYGSNRVIVMGSVGNGISLFATYEVCIGRMTNWDWNEGSIVSTEPGKGVFTVISLNHTHDFVVDSSKGGSYTITSDDLEDYEFQNIEIDSEELERCINAYGTVNHGVYVLNGNLYISPYGSDNNETSISKPDFSLSLLTINNTIKDFFISHIFDSTFKIELFNTLLSSVNIPNTDKTYSEEFGVNEYSSLENVIYFIYSPIARILSGAEDLLDIFDVQLKFVNSNNVTKYTLNDSEILVNPRYNGNDLVFEELNVDFHSADGTGYGFPEGDYEVQLGLRLKGDDNNYRYSKLFSFSSMMAIVTDNGVSIQNSMSSNIWNNMTDAEQIRSSNDSISLKAHYYIDNLPVNNLYGADNGYVSNLFRPAIGYVVTDISYVPINDKFRMYFSLSHRMDELNVGDNTSNYSMTIPLTRYKGSHDLTGSFNVERVGPIVTGVDDIDLKEISNIELSASGISREDAIFNDPDFLYNPLYKDVSSIGESLTLSSFKADGHFMTAEADISGLWTGADSNLEGVNIIKLYANVRETSRSHEIYYIIYGNSNERVIDIIDSARGLIPENEKNNYYETSNGDVIKLKYISTYPDFFTDLSVGVGSNELAFPDIFGREVVLRAYRIKIFTGNYWNSYKMFDAEDIADMLIDTSLNLSDVSEMFREDFNNRFLITRTNGQLPELITRVPNYPSRVVVKLAEKINAESSIVELYLGTAIRQESVNCYQILVMDRLVFDGQYGHNLSQVESLFDSSITNVTNIVNGTTNNGLWTQNSGVYKSVWLENDGNSVRLGSREGSIIEFKEQENMIYIFVKYGVIEDNQLLMTDTIRKTSINLDNNFYNLMDVDQMFKNGQSVYNLFTNYRFTGDVFVPSNCAINFYNGSGFVQDTNPDDVPKYAIDNNIRFFVEGSLLVDSGGADRPIEFGPSGLTGIDWASLGQIETKGMWGGIYINGGTVNINGARISNALDGLAIKNSSNAVINDLEIRNCEIGLHLYNSYPVITGEFHIFNNTLYGVKEDMMVGANGWEINQQLMNGISNNGINYYDYERGIIK